MPKVTLNGTGIYFQVDGAGPRNFLLFNGLGCTTRTWGEMAEGLAGIGHVVRFDLRGAGRTDFPEQTFTLETLAGDGLALLDFLNITQASLVGHAYGGRVAQVFARDFPNRVKALILCGTGGLFPPLPTVNSIDVGNPNIDRTTWEEGLLAQMCGPEFRHQQPERAQRFLDDMWADRAPRTGVGRQRQAAQATRVITYWGIASVPTLLLYGTEDRFGHAQNAHDLASRLRKSKLVFIDGAGHMAIREQPDRLLAEISVFLREQGL